MTRQYNNAAFPYITSCLKKPRQCGNAAFPYHINCLKKTRQCDNAAFPYISCHKNCLKKPRQCSNTAFPYSNCFRKLRQCDNAAFPYINCLKEPRQCDNAAFPYYTCMSVSIEYNNQTVLCISIDTHPYFQQALVYYTYRNRKTYMILICSKAWNSHVIRNLWTSLNGTLAFHTMCCHGFYMIIRLFMIIRKLRTSWMLYIVCTRAWKKDRGTDTGISILVYLP